MIKYLFIIVQGIISMIPGKIFIIIVSMIGNLFIVLFS